MNQASLACLIVWLAVMPAAAGDLEDFAGTWEGHFDFQDEPLEMRLHVEPGGEPAVTVDYPQLVFAGQPADWTVADDVLTVDLPLGLGEAELRRHDGGLRASRTTESGLPITITLERGTPFAAQYEDLEFGAAGPPIGGTVTFPPGAGPFPLAILLAGSGNPHRGNFGYASWADRLARRGMAALAYDRRPDNELGPGGALYTIDDQAADLSAAIDKLTADPRVDKGRILLLGKSRGAWIALATAAADPRVTHLALLGVAAVGVAQQDYQALEAKMRADGEAEEDIQAALAYMRVYFHVARHPQDWPRLAAASLAAAEETWGERVRHPEVVSDLEWFQAQLDFQPLTLISGITAPMFLAWGEEDRTSPPLMNRPLFGYLQHEASRAGSAVGVYPGAGHSLEGPLNVDDDPEVVWNGLNPGFLAEFDAWLQRQSLARQPHGD